jgi:NAD(P)-dependent dehydrogenase (short-subunit alcohol dehydrogenase family)
MTGKNCIVTGGNAGIGYETVLALAAKGANVTIISRNQDKAESALLKIREITGNENLDYVLADLSSQKSIRDAAKYILKAYKTIDVLVNNAGTWLSKRELTEDGVEKLFAVNHIAYFQLTHELLGALARSTEARVVCVGSDSHFHGKMHFEDISLGKKYNGLKAYAQSKLANALFVYELDRRLKKMKLDNISINCLQPGLVKTDIGLKHTISLHGLVWRIRRMGGVSPAEGAATSIYLASSEEVRGISGKYWDKCKQKPSSPKSYIEADAIRLWNMCLEMCQIEDYFSGVVI